MKGTLILLTVLLALSAEAKVIIRGKILSYDGKSKVSYVPTIEGIHTPYWKDIMPAANGSFKIEFENIGLGTTTVVFQRLKFRFLHGSNSNIYFEIDQSKITPWKTSYPKKDSTRRLALRQIKGDYAEINRFYNTSSRTNVTSSMLVDGTPFSRKILKAPTPQSAMAVMDSMMQKELNQIELMQTVQVEKGSRAPSAEELDFLKNEIRAFYGSSFLNAMFMRRYSHVVAHIRDSASTDDSYGEPWEKAIEQFIDEASHLKAEPASPDYNELILSLVSAQGSYRRYSFPQSGDPDSLVAIGMRVDTMLIRDEKPSSLIY